MCLFPFPLSLSPSLSLSISFSNISLFWCLLCSVCFPLVLLYFSLSLSSLSFTISLSFYLLTCLLLCSSFSVAFKGRVWYQTPPLGVAQDPGNPLSLQKKSPVGVMAPGQSAPGRAKSPLQGNGASEQLRLQDATPSHSWPSPPKFQVPPELPLVFLSIPRI